MKKGDTQMETTTAHDAFFKIDPECHLIGNMEPVNHFPGVQMWWRAIDGITRPLMQGAPEKYYRTLEPWELEKSADPELILKAMDKYGVDIACLLPEAMMDTTGYSSRWCTNGDAARIAETHPDRFIVQPNLSPIKHRGVNNAIWEMEYWVERGVRIFKYYPPEDTFINDPELWPFYKRAEELAMILDIHTGFCWVPPGKSKYCLPIQLDDVAREFPNLTLNAFHMGYPYCDDLNMVATGHPNVYLCLSLLVPWAITAPYKFGRILGEAMRFVGPDRIIWGTDSAGYGAQIGAGVLGLSDFQFPEELQWQYGYEPLTDDDKRKIFGGNLARLLGIDPSIRRTASVDTSERDAVMETIPAQSTQPSTALGLEGVLAELPALGETLKEKLKGLRVIFKFVVDGSKIWRVSIADSMINVFDGDGPADTTIMAPEQLLLQILTKEVNPVKAFMSGKVKIEGDKAAVMKLSKIL
jgi:predicted TIM-barrel fold metal-dependent hydrolase/putative sterol carrier protein